jgi:hypothetical protein
MARPAKFSLEANRRSLVDYFSPGDANAAETVTMQISVFRFGVTIVRRIAVKDEPSLLDSVTSAGRLLSEGQIAYAACRQWPAGCRKGRGA